MRVSLVHTNPFHRHLIGQIAGVVAVDQLLTAENLYF